MRWLVKAAASRGKWIDQSQSLNIFFNGTSGQELSELYLYAWEAGLKTTYYLRSLAATQVEKSTDGTAGTHLRKDSDSERKPDATFSATVIPGTAFVKSEVSVMAAVTEPILSPLPTPSPFTKEIREQEEKVEVKQKPNIKLHVAEEAICESCQ